MQVDLTKEEKVRILCTEDLFEIMRRILFREGKIGRNREHFWVIGLSNNYVLLFIELVSLGSSNKFVIDPGEVFQLAIHKLSTYVVLSHNHPGGFLQPSDADLDLTDQLIHAAEILSLEVIEHLIIDETNYFSFKDNGLIDKLEQSKRYAVGYIEVERIHGEGLEEGIKKGKKEGLVEGVEIGKEEGWKKGKEEGKEEKALEMAKAMKAEGESIDRIVRYTQLSTQEIEKLHVF